MVKNINQTQTIKEELLKLRRTSTKRAGGSLFHYSALCAAGDNNGMVGVGIAKSKENLRAINKAKEKAKLNMKKILITEDESIPHDIYIKKGAARILLKPAPKGAGIIAGGPLRVILELSGIRNISAKVIGTSNPVMNAIAVMEALTSLKETKSYKTVKPKK